MIVIFSQGKVLLIKYQNGIKQYMTILPTTQSYISNPTDTGNQVLIHTVYCTVITSEI